MAINKVVYGNTTLVDLTEDTATEEDVMEGKTFHDKSGLKRTGSATQGGRVQDVEVNGESVVNAQGVAEVVVPVIDDENITNESVYSSEKIEDRFDEYVDKDAVDVKSATTEFETINGGLLSSLKVALSPNQDLHGYSEPWVGGSRKNLLSMSVADIKANNTTGTWSGNVYTAYGVEFEVFADDAENVIEIKATRKSPSSSNAIFYVTRGSKLSNLNNQNLIINGAGSNTSGDTYLQFYLYDGTNVISPPMGGDSSSFVAAPTENSAVRIVARSISNPDGASFKPMIRLATESDPTFAPYSNICPISGHTQVEVGDDGKNRCNESGFEVGTFNINSSVGSTYTNMKQSQSARGRSQGIIDTGNIQMTISCDSNYSVYLAFFDSDGLYTGSNYGWTNSYTFTSPYIAVMLKRNDGANIQSSDFENVHIQIEKGSTATPYVPYNGYQVTVNLGGTYYSGTLDVVSGVLTVDKVKAVTPTRGALDSSGKLYTVNFSGGTIHNHNNTAIATPYVMCSHLDVDSLVGARDTQRKCICQYTGGVYIGGYIGEETALDNMLASADFSIVFELATPLTIQLTPQQVKALVGENHLSAQLEGQEIGEVKYKEVFDFNDVIKVANYFTLPLQTFTFTNKVCDVNDSRVTSNSLVDVYFTSDSMSSVEDAGITVESQNGKIVMTAEEQPVGTIQGRIKVVN